MDRYEALITSTLRRLGTIIMRDDGDDIGKFDRLHHWFLGACMKYGVDIYKSLAILTDVGKALLEHQRK